MLWHMRTTVRLDEHLLAQAKQHAVATGKTLTTVLEQALRESLARRSVAAPARPVRLKTFKGGGVRAGVDLDDSASLLDLMGSVADAGPPGPIAPAARPGRRKAG